MLTVSLCGHRSLSLFPTQIKTCGAMLYPIASLGPRAPRGMQLPRAPWATMDGPLLGGFMG